MPDIFVYILVGFFALYGLYAFIKYLEGKLLSLNPAAHVLIVVSIGHEEDAEYVVRSAQNKLGMCDGKQDKQLIIIDKGMDEEARLVVETLNQHYQNISTCKPEELEHLLKGRLRLQN